MTQSKLRFPLVLAIAVAFLPSVARQADAAYTFMDWVRTWPAFRPGQTALPAAATPVPVTPLPTPLTAQPAPAYTQPAPAYTPPALPYTQPAPTLSQTAPAQPAPTYAPPAASAAIGCGVPTCGAPTCGAPTCGVAAPSCGVAASCGAPACGVPVAAGCGTPTSTTVGYGPRMTYREKWIRVPTTNYRPVSTINPTTGAITTAMRPCTTYQWQMQRVPHVSLHPFGGAPVGYTTNAYSSNGAVLGYSQAIPGSCHNCGPSTTVGPTTTTPYYSTPAPSTTTTPAPFNAPSGASPTPNQSQPSQTQPTNGGAASQPPALSPTEVPNIQQNEPSPTTTNYPPESGKLKLTPITPSSSDNGDWRSGETDPKSTRPTIKISPVPDPEAENRNAPDILPSEPSLFDPRDKTASRDVRVIWARAPIRWPEPQIIEVSHRIEPDVSVDPAPRIEPPRVIRVDASGWKSVRP